MSKIYLDYNSQTPTDSLILDLMRSVSGFEYGNPSSLHSFGEKSKKVIEDARDEVLYLLGSSKGHFLFTGGGTESNNLALKGFGTRHIMTTAMEHKSVLDTLQFLEKKGVIKLTIVGARSDGSLNEDEILSSLNSDIKLISLMKVNNETGIIYPIEKWIPEIHKKGILVHSDLVQALGKVPLDLKSMDLDMASFSGNKIYGPRGVGGLYLKKNYLLEPLLHGGSQERERRAGTENVPAIFGFSQALKNSLSHQVEENERLSVLRDRLELGIKKNLDGVAVYGEQQPRVASTSFMSFDGIDDTLLIHLDQEGVAASAGSACASGAPKPSHVLLAMGVDVARAKGAVRFSLGKMTTLEEVDQTIEIVTKVVRKIR